KTRGVERQTLRFESYGALWEKMRPLAIYTSESITPESLSKLQKDLTEWYFSKDGGMYLLPHTRQFYFALQGFLRAVAKHENWNCKPHDGEHREIFDHAMGAVNSSLMRPLRDAIAKPDLRNWPGSLETLSVDWGKATKALADRWSKLNDEERF